MEAQVSAVVEDNVALVECTICGPLGTMPVKKTDSVDEIIISARRHVAAAHATEAAQ